jgi:hypothetical protein
VKRGPVKRAVLAIVEVIADGAPSEDPSYIRASTPD